MRTLILGGVRSGKSRLAETLAEKQSKPVAYIATATAGDEEMQARIELHRAHRPQHWMVIEESLSLAKQLGEQSKDGHCVIVDCLTLWLTNLLTANNEQQQHREIADLLLQLEQYNGEIILVSNETGLGVVPSSRLARQYCDIAGRLHQQLAVLCDRIVLTVAGLPLVLKGTSL